MARRNGSACMKSMCGSLTLRTDFVLTCVCARIFMIFNRCVFEWFCFMVYTTLTLVKNAINLPSYSAGKVDKQPQQESHVTSNVPCFEVQNMANHRESKSTKEEVSANLSWAKCGNSLVAEAHAQHVPWIRVQPRRCCRDGSELGNCARAKSAWQLRGWAERRRI